MEKDNHLALTEQELSSVYDTTYNIIENLPHDAINELLGGNLNDIDQLINDIIIETNNVINNNVCGIKDFGSLDAFEHSFDESLKIQNYNYFKTTMLPNFIQGWRNIEWGNLIQLYPYSAYICSRDSGKSYEFCFAWPLFRLYRYRRPGYFQRDTHDNANSKETIIITHESTLGKEHLSKIKEEIELNDLLREHLLPEGKRNALGKEKIITKTGSSVSLRTLESFKRGRHVGGIIVDDFLDDSNLYSKEQREKAIVVFKTEISPMVNPIGGSLIVSGTPFHALDLYGDLKKDPTFKVFEYPCMDINGNILAVERHSFDFLMKKKKSLGSIMFSREYLVTPISDASTIFPYDYLMTSIIGMENISLAYNIESYPIKLKRVVVGVDFAISGNVGADSTVISVWGIDDSNNFYLVYIEQGQGWSHDEQVSRMLRIDASFKPNKIYVEDNGFQRIMGRMARQRGAKNIEGFTTDEKLKKDWMDGLPSLSAIFERGEIKIPYKEGWSKDMADLIFGQFNSIGFNPDSGKLQAISGHDDLVMSCFFCIHKLRTKKGLKVSFIEC